MREYTGPTAATVASRLPGGTGRPDSAGRYRVAQGGLLVTCFVGCDRQSVATLRLTKSALAAVHRSTGHQDPTDNEGGRKVMAGIARANGRPQRQAKPLTETALAAVKATAKLPRKHQGRTRRGESARDAERRGRADVALLSVLRDGLLRRSEAAELRWGDLELQEDGSARLHVRRSKTDPEAEGVVLYIGQEATQALQAIMPEDIQPSWTPPGGSWSSPPARSAGGSMLQPRLRGWARVSLATRGGWAWPRTWRPRGWRPRSPMDSRN